MPSAREGYVTRRLYVSAGTRADLDPTNNQRDEDQGPLSSEEVRTSYVYEKQKSRSDLLLVETFSNSRGNR